MKYLKYLCAMLCAMLCICFVACSSDNDNDDDDDDKGGKTEQPVTLETIGGTSWQVISATYDEMVGTVCTFNKDKTLTFTPEYRGASHVYNTSGSNLIIEFGRYGYTSGPCVISGTTCKYTYHWYDTDGSIEDNGKTYTLTLIQK